MNILLKYPVCRLIGACAIAGLALASISTFSTTSNFSADQRPDQGKSADTLDDSNLRRAELLSEDDFAKVSLDLAALQSQLKDIKAAHARLVNRFRDVSLELSALRDSRRADDDVSSPFSDPSSEEAYPAERSRIHGFENMLASEAVDAAGSSDLHERIHDVLAQRESTAQLLDAHCGVSLCGITLSVTAEDFASNEMLVDSILDEVDGGGTMMFDEERAQLVLYVGRNGQSLPSLDPQR